MQVLITRPIEQAKVLADCFAEHGIETVLLPAQAISCCNAHINDFAQYEILIFTSANAVNCAAQQFDTALWQQKTVLAIGEATAKCLAKQGMQVVDYPHIPNSDNVLKLSALQNVAKQSIIIFTGHDGKTQLQQALAERGAKVTMAYVYRRENLTYQSFPGDATSIDMSICTSGQTLDNFVTILQQLKLERLKQKPLMVISQKMRELAQQLGFKSDIIVANSALNADIVRALAEYQQGHTL